MEGFIFSPLTTFFKLAYYLGVVQFTQILATLTNLGYEVFQCIKEELAYV